MLRILLLILLFYLLFRLFYKVFSRPNRKDDRVPPNAPVEKKDKPGKFSDDDGEFIDYEEVKED